MANRIFEALLRAGGVMVVCVVGAGTADAAEQEPVRSVNASRRVGVVSVDGSLDESAWTGAKPTGGFWQREPNEGKPPEYATEFRVLFDDEALYIGVRAHDPDPNRIRGLLTRRDDDSSSDWIYVGVDSYHDRRTSFTFGVNPAGVQRDFLIYDDTAEDTSWDAVWEAAASVDSEGWVAEFRIPYSQLRFSAGDEQVWGLQVARIVQRTSELSFWTPTPSDKQQRVSLFGELDGIRGIKPARRIEVLPYTVAGARVSDVEDGDPLNDTLSPEAGLGLDFKYGITSDLTLSGTVNPDFGQVEADPSEVNLTAQETFFEEKRPFFVEGANIFKFGLSQGDGDEAVEQLFYSRRIGAPPSAEPSGVYSRFDATTNIIGAAKLSGKTKGGWGIGALTALTGQEEARITTELGDEESEVIEPLASYTVLRLRKDFNGGRTNVGLAATGVHRSLADTGLDFLHDRAYSGGLQLDHRSADGVWMSDFRVMGSTVHGDPIAIDETQRASQRYYQRPDADHLDYDPTRTSLSGGGAMGSVWGSFGKHWRAAVGFDSRSPGFEVNDLGFQRNADYAVNWAWGQYRDETAGDVLLRYYVNTNWWSVADWAPELLSWGGNTNGVATLTNYWSFGGGANWNFDRLDTRLLRGGPAVRSNASYNVFANVTSDHRKRVRAGLGANWWQRPAADTWSVNTSASLSVQASSNIEVSAGPFLALRSDDTQYVDQLADIAGDTHYLLARIDQKTLGMTVQLLVDRDGDGMPELSFEPADFNFRELRSTVVLRWEYRPGSTLFLIWSHDRDSVEEQGQFDLGHDLGDLAEVTGEHVFLAKLNYWWGV